MPTGVHYVVTRGWGLGGTRYLPTRGYLEAVTPPPTGGAFTITPWRRRRWALLVALGLGLPTPAPAQSPTPPSPPPPSCEEQLATLRTYALEIKALRDRYEYLLAELRARRTALPTPPPTDERGRE